MWTGSIKRLSESSLARNVGWMFIGQCLAYALKVVYFIVIARLLGVLQYGMVVSAFALVNLVGEWGRLGSGTVLLRYVAADHKKFALYWGNLLLVTASVSGLLVVILTFAAPHLIDPASATLVLMLAVGTCICEQLTIGATQAFQAFEKMREVAIFNQLTSMLRTCVAIVMLIKLHHALAWQWAIASMGASAAGAVITLTTATIMLGWPKFSPHLAFAHAVEGAEYSFSSSTSSAYNDLDKAMLSHFGMSAANGIYGMAYRIVDMATVPIQAIQLAAEPRLFYLASQLPRNAVKLGRRLLKHSILISLAVAAAMYFLAPVIPMLTGKDFGEAVSALRWLCLIPVFRSVHKITGSLLMCTGLQRYRTITQLIAALGNFALNLFMIPRFGWRGAAWASLATDGALGLMNWSVVEILPRFRGVGSRSRAGNLLAADHTDVDALLDATQPLVSVVIPYYQQPKFLPVSVESAKRQSWPKIEIIVVDDGSTVPATEVLRDVEGVKLLRTENRGVSAARNLGFEQISGDYVLFLDADDILPPDAVRAHLRALASNPNAGFSFGAMRIIDEAGAEVKPAHICRPRDEYFTMLLEGNPVGCPGAALMPSAVFAESGRFVEGMAHAEDLDLFLRIARHRPLIRHTTCVLEYRQHSTNVSSSREKMLQGTMTVLDRVDPMLTEAERRKLGHARRRWTHVFRERSTLDYRLWTLYYKFRAMLGVSLRSYFTSEP